MWISINMLQDIFYSTVLWDTSDQLTHIVNILWYKLVLVWKKISNYANIFFPSDNLAGMMAWITSMAGQVKIYTLQKFQLAAVSS